MFSLILVLLFINLAIFLNFKKFAEVINVYDAPDKKLKLHKKNTPILGGLILIINYSIYLLFQLIFSDNFLSIPQKIFNIEGYLSILILIFGFFILGFYDDKYLLSASIKLLISTILLFVLLNFNSQLVLDNLYFTSFKFNIFLSEYSLIVTIVSILLFQNSINMFDGSNLQFSNFSFICILFLLIKSNFNVFFFIVSNTIYFLLVLK